MLTTTFATHLRERCYRSIRAASSLSATTQHSLNPVGVREPWLRKEQKSFLKLIPPKEGVNALHIHSLQIRGQILRGKQARERRDVALTEQESLACHRRQGTGRGMAGRQASSSDNRCPQV